MNYLWFDLVAKNQGPLASILSQSFQELLGFNIKTHDGILIGLVGHQSLADLSS
jgi:hypothetical protein